MTKPNHHTIQDYRRLAFERAIDRLKTADLPQRAVGKKFDRLWAAYRQRRDQDDLRAFLNRAGVANRRTQSIRELRHG